MFMRYKLSVGPRSYTQPTGDSISKNIVTQESQKLNANIANFDLKSAGRHSCLHATTFAAINPCFISLIFGC